MFANFSTEEMIVVCIVEVEEETNWMNSVRSLKKLQESINPQPLNGLALEFETLTSKIRACWPLLYLHLTALISLLSMFVAIIGGLEEILECMEYEDMV